MEIDGQEKEVKISPQGKIWEEDVEEDEGGDN